MCIFIYMYILFVCYYFLMSLESKHYGFTRFYVMYCYLLFGSWRPHCSFHGDLKSFLVLTHPTLKRGLAILVNKFNFTHALSLDAIKEKPPCCVAAKYYRILHIWLVLAYSSAKSFYNTHTHYLLCNSLLFV